MRPCSVTTGAVRRSVFWRRSPCDIAICKRRGWQPCSGSPDELLVPVPAATVVCGRVPPPIVTVATSIVPRRHDRIGACATSWLLLNAVRLLETGTPAVACGGRDVKSEACPTDGVGRAGCPRSPRPKGGSGPGTNQRSSIVSTTPQWDGEQRPRCWRELPVDLPTQCAIVPCRTAVPTALVDSHRTAGQAIGQITRQQAHHQVGATRFRPEIMQRNDVGVLKTRDQLRLCVEPTDEPWIIGQLGTDHLHRRLGIRGDQLCRMTHGERARSIFGSWTRDDALATTQTGNQTEPEQIMQIQEAIIESPEAQQAPEIPSPSAVDQKGPEARGRYGWVALLAVAVIAVALLVVQVTTSPEPSFELDPSYTAAAEPVQRPERTGSPPVQRP